MIFHVFDCETGEPLIGADIYINTLEGVYIDELIADIEGRCEYNAISDEHMFVTAHYVGYASLTQICHKNNLPNNLYAFRMVPQKHK
jgi:hypothetical protein